MDYILEKGKHGKTSLRKQFAKYSQLIKTKFSEFNFRFQYISLILFKNIKFKKSIHTVQISFRVLVVILQN